MRKTGIDKFSPRHRQSSAVLLDCHLSKCMFIDGGVPSDQAIGTNDAGSRRGKHLSLLDPRERSLAGGRRQRPQTGCVRVRILSPRDRIRRSRKCEPCRAAEELHRPIYGDPFTPRACQAGSWQ